MTVRLSLFYIDTKQYLVDRFLCGCRDMLWGTFIISVMLLTSQLIPQVGELVKSINCQTGFIATAQAQSHLDNSVNFILRLSYLHLM